MFWRRSQGSTELPKLLEAIESLSGALQTPPESPRSTLLEDRLASLEVVVAEIRTSLAETVAESRAMILEAKGEYRKARNAEERERYRAEIGNGDADGIEGITREQLADLLGDGVPPVDGAAGPAEGLPPVQPSLVGDVGDQEEASLRAALRGG